MPKIAVIGAGVVGLSTAINIQETLPPHARVRIIADKFFKETTSHGAPGIFLPTMQKSYGVSRDRLTKWYKDSWNFYSSLALSSKAAETGHMVSTGFVPCNSRNEKDRIYKDLVFSYRDLTAEEMKNMEVNHYKFCTQITTIVTNVGTYLTWLTTRFKENGGEIENRRINSLDELVGKYDIVVTCTGLGSKQLLNDDKVYPIRGQVARVHAPWIKFWVFPDPCLYIIPKDLIVLGGTRQDGNYKETVDPFDSKSITDRCLQILPSLKGFKLDHEWVGLRPARTPLRLEIEIIEFKQGHLRVVHNYGHGSSGISLSWGTSMEAARLVKELSSNSLKSNL